MIRIAVFISGNGTDLQSLIDAREDLTPGEIVLVVSNRKDAYGLTRAKEAGIQTAVIRNQEKLLSYLQENHIDLVVLAGYLAILSETFVKAYEGRIINIHPSLIPAFCGDGMYGLKVHEAALKRGVKVSGATVHFVNEITDGGPIIIQETVRVEDDDTPESLQARILAVEHEILPRAVQYYCQGRLSIESGKVIVK